MSASTQNTPEEFRSGSALKKVLFLVAGQVASRGLSFGLNAIVARTVGLAVFGLSAVNLYLLDAVILGLCREALRKSTQRFATRAVVSPRDRVASPDTVSSHIILWLWSHKSVIHGHALNRQDLQSRQTSASERLFANKC